MKKKKSSKSDKFVDSGDQINEIFTPIPKGTKKRSLKAKLDSLIERANHENSQH